ncbi:uncharacterized protein [Melanerpes formicivorus]|uniref:uncharacterized protein n=1 Tax=Melanerpes formicivorus TaxID=211600 RepID=UPI00358E3A89
MPLPQVLKGCLTSAKSWERERALRLCVRVLGTCKGRGQGAGRGRGVSSQSCPLGHLRGALSGPGLEEQGVRRRALLDSRLLPSLCPHSHEPLCFPRPWQLLLCSSCAAEGTHRCCSQLEDSTALWECHGCAGPSNASSATLQEAGPSTPRQPTQASSRASEAAEGCSSPSGPMRLQDRHEAVEKFVRENTQHNLQHPLVVCSVGETSDPEAMEQACWLCCQANADENICGIWKQHQDVCFHACCVYFANSVTPVAFSGDIPAFHLSAIRRAIQLSAEQGLLFQPPPTAGSTEGP